MRNKTITTLEIIHSNWQTPETDIKNNLDKNNKEPVYSFRTETIIYIAFNLFNYTPLRLYDDLILEISIDVNTN